MNISVITSCWKLPVQRVYQTVWQLSHQTEAPLEIIVVNASPDAEMRHDVMSLCDEFPLMKCIEAPQHVEVFNLSRSSNIGLRHTSESVEYVGVVALDLLYARNVIEVLAETVEHDVLCEAPMGSLRNTYELGDIHTLWDRWPDVLDACYSNPPPYSFSPGSISCVRRDWLMGVHGYDEERFSFSYGDSDLLHRAALCGIGVKIIPWDRTQIIHIEHQARFGIQTTPPDGKDMTTIRNGDKWGEI